MRRSFAARVCEEDEWYVAQTLEVDVASQGQTADDALMNLSEALALYFEPPVPTIAPQLRNIEVEIATSQAASLPGSHSQTRCGGVL